MMAVRGLAIGAMIWVAGCERPATPRSDPAVRDASPVQPVERPASVAPLPDELARRVDHSLAAATRFLVERQSDDGAWRSEVYGPFKGGDALTPLVLAALSSLPIDEQPKAALEKGRDWLDSRLTNWSTSRGDATVPPLEDWTYPVYSLSLATRAFGPAVEHGTSPPRGRWSSRLFPILKERQLVASRGWEPTHPYFGGWGYSAAEVSPFAESNVSATVYALEGLSESGPPRNLSLFQDALVFLKRCQNFESEPASDLDDGGFFFLPGDSVRNKAGPATADGERFHSYGSATADGLRGLLLCGLAPEHPRVVAARRWLETHFTVERVPGEYAPNRDENRDGVFFYYVHSLARTFRQLGLRDVETPAGRIRWTVVLAEELLRRQRANGGWENDVVDQREDDPVVATAFALETLVQCRSPGTSEHWRTN